MNLKNSRYTAFLFAFIISPIISILCAQTNPVAQAACSPEVNFIYDNTTSTFCLNTLNPDADSCIHFSITLKKKYNITAHFSRSLEQTWTFDSITDSDKSTIDNKVKINIRKDENGELSGVQIFAGSFTDTTSKNLLLQKQYDIPKPQQQDHPSMSDFVFGKSAFFCAHQLKKPVVVYLKYEYPGNYMRRGQYLNYPELKMFHCGSSVHIPDAGTIAERGDLINNYHILNPELRYKEAASVKKVYIKPREKKERKHFLKLRPIN